MGLKLDLDMLKVKGGVGTTSSHQLAVLHPWGSAAARGPVPRWGGWGQHRYGFAMGQHLHGLALPNSMAIDPTSLRVGVRLCYSTWPCTTMGWLGSALSWVGHGSASLRVCHGVSSIVRWLYPASWPLLQHPLPAWEELFAQHGLQKYCPNPPSSQLCRFTPSSPTIPVT